MTLKTKKNKQVVAHSICFKKNRWPSSDVDSSFNNVGLSNLSIIKNRSMDHGWFGIRFVKGDLKPSEICYLFIYLSICLFIELSLTNNNNY